MRNEDKQGFLFILNHLKRLYTEAELPFPRVIITDADLALKNAIMEALPNARHFLCLWHVNKAIQAWAKKLYKGHQLPPDTLEEQQQQADEVDEKWGAVLQEWQKVTSSKTEAEYRVTWNSFRVKFELEDGLVQYIWRQWLFGKREQFVRCYTDRYLHFGNVTTSRLEGMHSVLKRRLHSSQGDLAEIVKKFKYLQRDRIFTISYNARMSQIMTALELHHPVWALVRGRISHYALSRVRQIMIKLDLTSNTILKDCTGTLGRAWGLPCPHTVKRLLGTIEPLEVEDFDIHWRLDRDALPQVDWTVVAQPPERIHRGRRQDITTTRFPSEFERIDQALRAPPSRLLRGSHALRGQGRQRGRIRGQPRVPGGRLQPGESVLQF